MGRDFLSRKRVSDCITNDNKMVFSVHVKITKQIGHGREQARKNQHE